MKEPMNRKSLKIALDYDKTFTEDKELWSQFARHALSRGHDVRFVSFRMDVKHGIANQDIFLDARELKIPIVYSNYQPKRSAWQADIWIDDMPELIPVESTSALII